VWSDTRDALNNSAKHKDSEATNLGVKHAAPQQWLVFWVLEVRDPFLLVRPANRKTVQPFREGDVEVFTEGHTGFPACLLVVWPEADARRAVLS
jgi:hypothetical protein